MNRLDIIPKKQLEAQVENDRFIIIRNPKTDKMFAAWEKFFLACIALFFFGHLFAWALRGFELARP